MLFNQLQNPGTESLKTHVSMMKLNVEMLNLSFKQQKQKPHVIMYCNFFS